jgi:hypothetical protein
MPPIDLAVYENTTAFSATYSVLGYCVAKEHFYDNAVIHPLSGLSGGFPQHMHAPLLACLRSLIAVILLPALRNVLSSATYGSCVLSSVKAQGFASQRRG